VAHVQAGKTNMMKSLKKQHLWK